MKIFDKKVKEGKSILYSRIYAENIVDDYHKTYSELYAQYFEEAILSGLSKDDAYGFAEKKADDEFH
jgi:hypothetical protein